MASEVGIFSRALIKVGADPILSFDTSNLGDGVSSLPQVLGKELYDDMRDDELTKHWWNFAMDRAELALSVDTPLYGYTSQFTLPPGFLTLAEVNGVDVPPRTAGITSDDRLRYRVEGGVILSDETTMQIRFVKRITDPNLFSTIFIDVLVARLAYELAVPLRNDQVLHDRLVLEYDNKAAAARGIDSAEDPADQYQADTWELARENY